MKKIILIVVILLNISCSFKTAYLMPAIKGQLIDATTNSPIANKGYVVSILLPREESEVKTDSKGFFYIKHVSENSFLKFGLNQKHQNIPQEFYIYIDGYENKVFNFSQYPKHPQDGGLYTKSEVDVGKIFLNPEK